MKNIGLDTGIKYAKRGWYVFPAHSWTGKVCSCLNPRCESPGKHPRTRCGFLSASRDEAQIRQWFQQMPDSNLAIRTGKESDLVVLDIDAKNGGLETLRDLEKKYGVLPDTVIVITGGGGLHYFFKWPGVPVQSRVGLFPGIDIRGSGGYVIAPPSIHASGRKYMWEVSSRPSNSSLASMPEWLLHLAQQGTNTDANGSQGKWRSLTSTDVEAGRRNQSLTSLVGGLLRYNILPATDVLEFANFWNRKRCKPPLSDKEVCSTVNSVAGLELRRRRKERNHG